MYCRKPILIGVLIAVLVAISEHSFAAESFYNILRSDCRVSGSGIDARSMLQRLEQTHGFVIWMDRRVDHSVKVSLAAEPASLESTLLAIGDKLNADVAFLDSLAIIAPRGKADVSASMILRLRAQMRNSNGPVAKRLLSLNEVRWEAVSSPSQIFDSLKMKWKVSLQHELPHDIWAERSLGEVDAATALVLLCSGFDVLPVAADGKGSFKLYPTPEYVSAEAKYPSVRLSDRKLAEVSAIDPKAEIRKLGGMTLVKANAEAHHLLKSSLAKVHRTDRPKPVVDALSNRFTLRVPGTIPVQAILENVCKKCAVDLDVERASSHRLSKRVSLDFDDTLVTKILTDVCSEAELDVQFVGQSVIVIDK